MIASRTEAGTVFLVAAVARGGRRRGSGDVADEAEERGEEHGSDSGEPAERNTNCEQVSRS